MVDVNELNKTPDGDKDPDEINPTISIDPAYIDESETEPSERREGIPESPVPDLIEVVGRGIQDVFTLENESGKTGDTLRKERESRR